MDPAAPDVKQRRLLGRGALDTWLPSLSIALASCGFPKPPDVAPDDATAGSGHACTQTTCIDSMLEACVSGMVQSTEPCPLGCFSDQSRCNDLAPSNGLGPVLDQAGQEAPTTLPDGAVVDSDSGIVMSALGTPIQVTSIAVVQPGGATLRALLARSWIIHNVRIRGTAPVAFIARDEIEIQGVVDASADGDTGGPGALTCEASAGGGGVAGPGFFFGRPSGSSVGYPAVLWITNGFGGGGFGTAGAAGGLTDAAFGVGVGGSVNGNVDLVPLRGGCQGGGGLGEGALDPPLHRGAGGGAIQLVAIRSIHLGAGGVVHVGGGRGAAGALGHTSDRDTSPIWGPAGGGSGGGILIESASVVIDDGAGLVADGGGGGGYGACTPAPDGVDAPPSASTPEGGACPPGTNPVATGGAGATTAAGMPGGDTAATDRGSAGSGGGGLGRIRINTVDGLYTVSVNSLVRGVTTTGTVRRR